MPPDYAVIDTSGRTMMPGMIELHGHLILLGHGNYGQWFPWMAAQGPATLTTVMGIAARQRLRAGVTPAVGLGAPLARLEGRVILGKLLARYGIIELDRQRVSWQNRFNLRGLVELGLRVGA